MRISSNNKIRPKVVEQTGLPISALLVDPMQGEQDTCGKDDCNPCQSGTSKKMSCRRSSLGGMVYNLQCMICKDIIDPNRPDENIKCLYHGRTCRCTRQKEHNSGAEGRKEDNALYKHIQLFHPNQMPKFVFEAEKFFNSPNLRGRSYQQLTIYTRVFDELESRV